MYQLSFCSTCILLFISFSALLAAEAAKNANANLPIQTPFDQEKNLTVIKPQIATNETTGQPLDSPTKTGTAEALAPKIVPLIAHDYIHHYKYNHYPSHSYQTYNPAFYSPYDTLRAGISVGLPGIGLSIGW